jgi:hypothetical protein
MRIRSKSLTIAGWVALIFGAVTVFSGGRALFGGAEAEAAVGAAVGFVLWFNFLAGFAYMLAGGGLVLRHRPAVWISIAIFVSTAFVGIAFGVHVLQGGAFEMRTVGAMFLRTGVWAAISMVAIRDIAKLRADWG